MTSDKYNLPWSADRISEPMSAGPRSSALNPTLLITSAILLSLLGLLALCAWQTDSLTANFITSSPHHRQEDQTPAQPRRRLAELQQHEHGHGHGDGPHEQSMQSAMQSTMQSTVRSMQSAMQQSSLQGGATQQQPSGAAQPLLPVRDLQAVGPVPPPHSPQARYQALAGSWNFSLPLPARRRSLVHLGAAARLRRVVHAMLSGRPVRIGLLGGATSCAAAAPLPDVATWSQLLVSWLQGTLGPGAVSLRNAALAGSAPAFMALCGAAALGPDVDLVVLDYTAEGAMDHGVRINPPREAYERMMRHLMRLPHHPALILLQMPSWSLLQPRGSPSWRPFMQGMDEVLGALALYYDCPWISVKAAAMGRPDAASLLHPSGDGGQQQQQQQLQGETAHRVVADLVAHVLLQVAGGLAVRPWEEDDTQLYLEGLPPPMKWGNEVPPAALCAHHQALAPLVAQAKGFKLSRQQAAGGRQQAAGYMYVADKPASLLRLQLPLELLDQGAAPRELQPWPPGQVAPSLQDVEVAVAFWRSTAGMGAFSASCESGCECEERVINAHHAAARNGTYLAVLKVRPSPPTGTGGGGHCDVVLRVVPESDTGRHTVIVSGVIVTGSGWEGVREPQQLGDNKPSLEDAELSSMIRLAQD